MIRFNKLFDVSMIHNFTGIEELINTSNIVLDVQVY